jgi:uncharacterized protein
MTAVTEPPPRIATLDIVRGVAVMGILAMNIVAFAMPFQAYMNPVAFGSPGTADFVSWVFSFIFIDGKMRGLFSFLFGASTLLVIQLAQAKGENPASIHYRRMLWLLVFGMLHFYLIWFGDILIGYAAMGMLAYLFRNLPVRKLLIWGGLLVLVQFLVFCGLAGAMMGLEAAAAAPGASADTVREWQGLQRDFGVLTGQHLTDTLALYRGGYLGIVQDRVVEHGVEPFMGLFMFGWETLGYMLFGMAALKTGFLKGEWSNAAYTKTALIGFAVGIPAYALLAWAFARSGFTVPMTIGIVMAGTVPFRPLMVVATGAVIILLTRGGGAIVERIAAAGRAAFTNYLGTSIIMTTLFYGYGGGLFGTMGRAELWLVVIAMWGVMLLWSKPWLDRYRYGPLEWLWRSLSRGSRQSLAKDPPAALAG